MKITTVTVGKSVQVFQVGMPEQWLKLSITAELENTPTEAAVQALFEKIDEQIKKHTPDTLSPGKPSGDLFFNVTTQKEER